MHERALSRFIYEVAHHCSAAQQAIQELGDSAQRIREVPADSTSSSSASILQPMTPSEIELQSRVFRSIYSALLHSACVLQLLWPRGGKGSRVRLARKRSQELRAELGLSPQEPSELARDLRNTLAHFDERLDRWAVSGVAVGSVADVIGPREGLLAQLPLSAIHRWFDDSTFELHVFENVYDLRAVSEFLGRISVRAQDRLKSLWAMSNMALQLGARSVRRQTARALTQGGQRGNRGITPHCTQQIGG